MIPTPARPRPGTDPLQAPGIAVESGALMGLRHLARRGAGAASRVRTGLPGGIVTRRRGRGSEPDDVRLWAEGDDVRHIDRNATARTGILHVRTHHEERDRAVVMLADFRPSMLVGTRRALRSVAAAEALALLGWRIAADGGRVGLLSVGGAESVALPPRGGGRGMAALCQGLARAHGAALAADPQADPPLGPALERARALLPAGGHLVLASALDAPGEEFAETLAVLAERVSVSLILVSDAFEREAPPGLYPYATPDGQRGTARIGGRRPAPEERVAGLARLGVTVVRLDTETGPDGFAPLLERLDAVL
ncbi:DUF58 domain-containing protein [Methylobacterium platani]|uniref:DUF58 domain-containing protein n=2 Tax=Methylobacterium platani TaxID=427683 RepID=A0A179SA82_9HYPH|nr:DUF58 domain-containing protein [Methylobacterium platani]KMO21889.1 hypothetical protein SQ03_02160 [Methylobacterium platani JCM 14648]OAS24674.1 hypothetical protein A5481_13145 [Methylobacterium platani]